MFFPWTCLISSWQESTALSCCHGPHICRSCFGSWHQECFKYEASSCLLHALSQEKEQSEYFGLFPEELPPTVHLLIFNVCNLCIYRGHEVPGQALTNLASRLPVQFWARALQYILMRPCIKFSTGPLLHSMNEWLLFLFVVPIWCGPMPYLGCVVQSMQWIKNCSFPNGLFKTCSP